MRGSDFDVDGGTDLSSSLFVRFEHLFLKCLSTKFYLRQSEQVEVWWFLPKASDLIQGQTHQVKNLE